MRAQSAHINEVAKFWESLGSACTDLGLIQGMHSRTPRPPYKVVCSTKLYITSSFDATPYSNRILVCPYYESAEREQTISLPCIPHIMSGTFNNLSPYCRWRSGGRKFNSSHHTPWQNRKTSRHWSNGPISSVRRGFFHNRNHIYSGWWRDSHGP